MANREDDAPRAVQALAQRVRDDGGETLAVYREPVGEHWQIFCLLPLARVAPTPYQRDLSPTHAKRLQEAVKKIGRFVDPIVVVTPQPGGYWTPNGHHRLRVLQKLKAESRARKRLPSFAQTFAKLREDIEAFDVAKVRYDEIQRTAVAAVPAAE